MLRLTGDPVRALSIHEGRGVGSTAVEHTLPNREVASLNLTGGLAFSNFNFFSGPSLKLKSSYHHLTLMNNQVIFKFGSNSWSW